MGEGPILIVDDNPANLKLARICLETEGFTVHTAPDAETAIASIRHNKPRLILMDLQLPGMDGLVLTRQLKADSLTNDIVIIAVTSYAMRGDEDRSRGAGCDDYLTKPIDTRALAGVVRRHLGKADASLNDRLKAV